MAKKKSKNPEKENNKSKQYVLKHSSLFKDRSTNTNSIITRSEIPYVPAKSHATSNSTHDSGISPPSPSPAFHPSGRSIPTVRNFGPAPDYHEINCQSQFHPRSAPRKERQREGGERRGRLFDTAGPATAARYHGVASIPHPLSGVSIRKRPMVSARNVSRTLHASFSRQA